MTLFHSESLRFSRVPSTRDCLVRSGRHVLHGPSAPCQGVHPSQACKSREIGVVGMDRGLQLHGDRGDVGIGHEWRDQRPCSGERREDIEMPWARLKGIDRRKGQPRPHVGQCQSRSHRLCHDAAAGHDAEEPDRHDPGKADGFAATEQSLSPGAGLRVVGGFRVVGIHEQVDVRDHHDADQPCA